MCPCLSRQYTVRCSPVVLSSAAHHHFHCLSLPFLRALPWPAGWKLPPGRDRTAHVRHATGFGVGDVNSTQKTVLSHKHVVVPHRSLDTPLPMQ